MIWLAGDGCLTARVPNARDPSGPAHLVKFPADAAGMAALVRVLAARRRGGHLTIGTESAPTQAQVLAQLMKTAQWREPQRIPQGVRALEDPAAPRAFKSSKPAPAERLPVDALAALLLDD
jgi:hypothetical protein